MKEHKAKTIKAIDWLSIFAILFFAGGWAVDRTFQAMRLPVPYDMVQIFESGYREDGRYWVVGELRKLKCERLPIAENGFHVLAAIPGEEVFLGWRPEDGRHYDENRAPGVDGIALSIEMPDQFYWAEARTIHACPNNDDPDPTFVKKTFHRIPGNIIEVEAK